MGALHATEDDKVGDSIAGHAVVTLAMSRHQAPDFITQSLVQCPITALEFYTSTDEQLYVLVAEDGWLKVHDAEDHGLRGQLRVFAEQAIHGMSVSEADSLLIWGAQSVTTVPKASVELLIQGFQDEVQPPLEHKAPDWVFDGSMSPYDPERGVLVTAHNELLPFAMLSHGESRQRLAFTSLLSPSRPILYSAAVEWTAPSCVLVAAGTVFGEIIVWKCCLRDNRTPEVLYVLTGHEGSIFGLSLATRVDDIPTCKQRILASCSDDRTIRIWDISEYPKTGTTAERKVQLEEARETGFGENNNSEAGDDTTTTAAYPTRCLAMAMGHVSRIWHVRFAYRSLPLASPVEVYSFGEDTTIQKWQMTRGEVDGAPSTTPNTTATSQKTCPWSLEHAGKFACHNGKHIWSVAVRSDDSGRTQIVTGGADGKVTVLRDEHHNHLVASDNSTVAMSLNDVVRSLPNSGSSENSQSLEVSSSRLGKDGFLRYAWLSEAKLLVSTASGRLLIGTFEQAHIPCWTEIDTSESIRQDLRSYIVLRAVPGLTVIGSASGRLYVAQETGLWELTRLSGKITDILFIAESGEGEDDQDYRRRILVTVLGSTQATIIHFSYQGPDIYMDQSYVPLHMGFVVTSIGVCGDILVLGSRKGGIAVYRKTADGHHIHQTFRNDCKTKGGDAITSIIPLPPEEGSEHKYVLTTCRDGKYRIYELVSSTTGLSLELRHETTPPLGPMLEGAYLASNLDLIIYGFRSTNFVVWNETRQEEIASVPCGGAHRTFDFRWGASDTNTVRFVFSKASAMGIYWQDRPSLEVLKPGGHGREIRAVASEVSTIATGAEDTSIRIWDWPNDNDEVTGLRCRAVLQKHTAGIQALKWTQQGNYLLSSAGAEEFFVWKVTNLESQYKGLAVVCEAVYPFRSPDADLRITDFDTTTLSHYTGDPESGLAVTLVFSNSTIKTYHYTRNGGFVLTAKGRYTGACLTQVSHLNWMRETESLALITASTDGHLAIWKDTELDGNYQIIFKQRLHENSIKSFHSQSRCLNGWQIFSVGDDQSLSILSFQVDFVDPVFEDVEAVRVKDAHAAAITGIALLATSDRYYYLVTISNDQRLKIWQVGGFSSGSQPVRVCLVIDQYSALADPGGVRLLDTEGNFMVGGVGMEVWTLPRPLP